MTSRPSPCHTPFSPNGAPKLTLPSGHRGAGPAGGCWPRCGFWAIEDVANESSSAVNRETASDGIGGFRTLTSRGVPIYCSIFVRGQITFIVKSRNQVMFHTRRLEIAILTGAIALLVFGALVATQQAQGPPQAQPEAPMPAVLQNYKPVTADRLKKPEDGDWLTVRRTYDGWGYSPLEQVNTKNIDKLQPAWVFSTGVTSGHEAPAMVNNGVMFVATPS